MAESPSITAETLLADFKGRPRWRAPSLFAATIVVCVGSLFVLTSHAFDIGPDAAVRKTINGWLTEQRKGESGAFYWTSDRWSSPDKFFAVRNWEIVDVMGYESGGHATVRIDSSNKGGVPITVLWKVYLKSEKGGPPLISLVSQVE